MSVDVSIGENVPDSPLIIPVPDNPDRYSPSEKV